MAWTTPSTWVSGAILTAAQLNQQLRDNLDAIGGAWTSFTPTMSNGWSLGNATVTSRYIKAGRLVIFSAHIKMGSTTTFGAGALRVALPATSTAAKGDGWLTDIQAFSLDAGVSTYPFWAKQYDTNTLEFYVMNASGTYLGGASTVTNTVPFTWATNDELWFSGTYEAAS